MRIFCFLTIFRNNFEKNRGENEWTQEVGPALEQDEVRPKTHVISIKQLRSFSFYNSIHYKKVYKFRLSCLCFLIIQNRRRKDLWKKTQLPLPKP